MLGKLFFYNILGKLLRLLDAECLKKNNILATRTCGKHFLAISSYISPKISFSIFRETTLMMIY